MGTVSNSAVVFNPAVTHLSELFRQYEQNRRTTQDKWDRNHRAFIREEGDEIWKTGEGQKWRSKTYIGKTREKVMAAAAMVIDTILQGGKVPYAYKPSPWQNGTDLTPEDQMMVEASIEAMTNLTNQQLVDTHADRQLMKHAMCMGLYGCTWGKKIVHSVKRTGWRKQTITVDGIEDYSRVPTAETWAKWQTQFMSPGWVYVPVWDIFSDVEAGEDIQNGAGVFHRQIASPYWLRSKIGRPFFITANLIAAAKEAQTTGDATNVAGTDDWSTLAPLLRDVKFRKNTLTYREFWGRIPRKMAEAIESSLEAYQWNGELADIAPDIEEEPGDEVEVLACTCGSHLVRYCRNEPDNRPFAYAKCEDNIEEETPWGIADNCEPLQMVINGAFRAFEDNKKLAANVILAIKRRLIKNCPTEITPGMKLELAEECDDARKAIQQVVIQDVGQTLLSLLEIANPMLDDASMVPRIAQGYTDPNTQTATEISVRQAQASKYMGMLIRNLDEGIIEPLIEYLYQFNMDDPEVEAGKGNYIVQALGFSAYQNKVERVRKIQELMALALSSPVLTERTKIDNLYRELVKATDLDPDFVVVSEQELQPPQPPPVDPLQAAEVEANVKKTEAETMLTAAEAQAVGSQVALEQAQTTKTLAEAEHVGDEKEVRNIDE